MTRKISHRDRCVVGVGKAIRFRCDECRTEFTVLHEPDYQDPHLARGFNGRPKRIEHCPFCGTDYTMLVLQNDATGEDL